MCRILATCAETRVAELKFGDLHVVFGRHTENQLVDEVSHPEPATEIAATLNKVAEDALKDEEVRFREEQLALLRIENPYLAEKLLTEGEIGLDGVSDGDDESDEA